MGKCEQSYGFLPCSDTAGGSAFLTLVYGYLVLMGANLIGEGGEHLSDLDWAPAVIGGLVLPIIGALPDSIIILVAGLNCGQAAAQEQVAIGMGTLAGSTIMLLTVVWGGSLLAGRCNLDRKGYQQDRTLTVPWWDLWHSGVSTDARTPRCAWAMAATALLYLVVEIPALFGLAHDPRAALAGSVMCLCSLLAYCTYQALQPASTRRRHLFATHKHFLRVRAVRCFSIHAEPLGGIMMADGSVRPEATASLFRAFDEDGSGYIDKRELRAMIVSMEICSGPAPHEHDQLASGPLLDGHVALWMREFDADGDGQITQEEFHQGIVRWVQYRRKAARSSTVLASPTKAAHEPLPLAHVDAMPEDACCLDMPLLDAQHHAEQQQPRQHGASHSSPFSGMAHAPYGDVSSIAGSVCTLDSVTDTDSGSIIGSDADGDDQPPPRWHTLLSAALKFAAGTAICIAFADPFVGSVTDLSAAIAVPAFVVAFVAAPLASNASELITSLNFARSKRSRHISITFNQVYGAVVMNNTMCLGLFLLVVYLRGLAWTYTSEVVVIMVPTLLLSWLAGMRCRHRAAWALPVLGLYPAALLLQYFLKYVLMVG